MTDVFAGDDPTRRKTLLADALMTATRGLDTEALVPEDMDSFEKIVTAEPLWAWELNDAARRTGVRLSSGLMRTALAACMAEWEIHGRSYLIAWEAVPQFDPLPTDPSLALSAVHGFLRALALFDDGHPAAVVCRPCLDLANAFESVGRLDDALASAFTALNFAQASRSSDMSLRAAGMAVRYARAVGNAEGFSVALAANAHVLSCLTNTADQLRAFDAVAAALRHLPSLDGNRAGALDRLWFAVHDRAHLMIWRPIVGRLRNPIEARSGDVAAATAEQISETLKLLTTTMGENYPVSLLAATYVELERARERLLPDLSRNAEVTSWVTGSFDHRAYMNAIPNGRSLLRERDLNESLLILGHEFGHVMALQGYLGVAFTAFRAAAVELELMIWEYAQPLSFASLRDLIAPLDTTDVRALARAEQGLDVARKRQILQATWSPWFEGIATFGELAVDPSADDAEADIGLVLLQTVDESFETSDAATFVEWFDDRRRIAETMYARAQLKEGPPRLRAYLDAYHGKYLAGYLTVRSVVSGWRRQVKRPLGGAEAYRLLMHRTRFDTRRAIPDLSLPTAHFKIEAEALLLSWIQDVAATNAEDIEAFLSANGRQIFWRDNRLVADPSPDETAAYLAESNNWYRQCVSSALHTNVGASDDVLNRVPDADEKIRTLLKVLAGGLNPKDPILADDLARYVLGQRRVLTLGRVTAPFWLEGSTEKVLYLIRTTEHGRESGMSSYDLVRMPVDSTSFHTLAAEVERLREPRMTIYRMVDLVPAHADKDRGLGRQLVAFKYGDWCHMENRGVLTDLKQVPGEFASDVETQIQPPDMVEGEYRLAEFVSVAMRTIQRLRSGTGWNVEDLVGESGIEAWTRRIIALADDVIAAAKGDPQTESDVNRRLLGKIFGEGNFTDRLIDKGIMSLDDDDPERREQLIDALYRSGFKPAPEVPWLDNAPGTAGQLFARLHGGWDVKPLVELERE